MTILQISHYNKNLGPIWTRSIQVFVSWIGRPLLVVFVSQGRNWIITIASARIVLDWRCLIVAQHFYWERRSWSKKRTTSVLCAEKISCKSSCRDWCFNFVREWPAPEAMPSEPLLFVWPSRKTVPLIWSIRAQLNLWLTELSIIFFYFGLVRISPFWAEKKFLDHLQWIPGTVWFLSLSLSTVWPWGTPPGVCATECYLWWNIHVG